MEMLIFYLDFFLEARVMNLTMLIQKKYLLKKMSMIFQLIIVLLTNLTFYISNIYKNLMIKDNI